MCCDLHLGLADPHLTVKPTHKNVSACEGDKGAMRGWNVGHKSLEANEGGVVVILFAWSLVLWDDLIAHLLQHLVNVMWSHLVAKRHQAAASPR